MSRMQDRVRRGAKLRGGIIGYPLDQLHEEVAYLAYHFHWPLDQILSLEHADRRRWVEEISKINRRLNGDEGRSTSSVSTSTASIDWDLFARLGFT